MDNKKIYLDVILNHDDLLPLYIKKDLGIYKLLFLKFFNKFRRLDAQSYIINDFVENCIEFVSKLTNEEKGYINEEFISFFRDATFKVNTPSLMMTLFRPDDTDDLYIFYMSEMIKDHLYGYPIDINTEFCPLKKLIAALNYINKNYTIYLYDYNVISIIIAYCYIYDDNYKYLYNYMDNPDYFMDKIRNSGIELDNKNKFQLHSDTSNQIYHNIDKLFIKDKIIIK